MRDNAVVTKINGINITVVPLITNACLSCKEGCAKQGHPFTAFNARHFPLQIGALVKIGTSAKAQLFQGVFSLLFPVLSAVGGYFAAIPFAAKTGWPVTEGMQAGFVLAGLLISTALVVFVSRSGVQLTKPEITEIL